MGEIEEISLKTDPARRLGLEGLAAYDPVSIGLAEETTERNIDAETIRTSEQKYRLLFNSGDDATFFHDAEGRFIEVNEAACKKLGYSCEELLKMKTSDIDDPNFHPDITAIEEGLRSTGHAMFEQVHVAKNGQHIPVELNLSAITVDGKTMILSVARDISERKRSETSLAKAKKHLEEQVEERTRELWSQVETTKHAEAELRALSVRMILAQEEERRSIAKELHDEIGQTLTVLKLMAGSLEKLVPGDLKPRVEGISKELSNVMSRIRLMSQSLRPTVLDDLGLLPGLEWLFARLKEQAGLQIEFECPKVENLEQKASIAAYRIIQESLTNVMRHSGVKSAFVQISFDDNNNLRIRVTDYGRGFNPLGLQTSTGLSAMKERAKLVGGKVELESAPGKGTVVIAVLPLH